MLSITKQHVLAAGGTSLSQAACSCLRKSKHTKQTRKQITLSPCYRLRTRKRASKWFSQDFTGGQWQNWILKASLFSIHLVPQSQGHRISFKDVLFHPQSVLVRGIFDWNVYSEFIHLQVSLNYVVLFPLCCTPSPAPSQSPLVWAHSSSTTTSVHKFTLPIYLQFCWWSYWSLSLRFAWSSLVWRPPQTSGDQCSTYKERK